MEVRAEAIDEAAGIATDQDPVVIGVVDLGQRLEQVADVGADAEVGELARVDADAAAHRLEVQLRQPAGDRGEDLVIRFGDAEVAECSGDFDRELGGDVVARVRQRAAVEATASARVGRSHAASACPRPPPRRSPRHRPRPPLRSSASRAPSAPRSRPWQNAARAERATPRARRRARALRARRSATRAQQSPGISSNQPVAETTTARPSPSRRRQVLDVSPPVG